MHNIQKFTKKEFEKIFRKEYMPGIRDKERQYTDGIDYPLRREEWNNIIDLLVKDNVLPKQAFDWVCPW